MNPKHKITLNKIKNYSITAFLILACNINSIGQLTESTQTDKEASKQQAESFFKLADKLPSYPEGDLALDEYISQHLLIPQKAVTNHVEGKVLLEFIVNEDGSLSEIEIVRDLRYGCGEAALQLVEKMPAWEPAERNGKPVKMAYTLAVPFYSNSTHKNTDKISVQPSKPSTVVYKSQREILKEYIDLHQTIAIIPTDVQITDHKLIKNKKSDPDKIHEAEKELETAIQYSFYERMLWLKERDKLKDIQIQDIEITNKLLFKHGVENMYDLTQLPQNEIADMLGVDAIFWCRAEIEQVMSKGAAMAISFLNSNRVSPYGRNAPPTDYCNIIMRLYDGQNGQEIWNSAAGKENNLGLRKSIKIVEQLLKERLTTGFPYHYKF